MKLRLLLALEMVVSAVAQYGPAKTEPFSIAGHNVELTVTLLDEHALRISVAPLNGIGSPAPVRDEPVVVQRQWPAPAVRLRSLLPEQTAKSGSWSVVTDGSTVIVSSGRTVKLRFEFAPDGSVSFPRGDAPAFGLGQGGPQFDRRGHAYAPKNDHGAYDLARFGGRMPVPLVVSAAGWALFFHQPLGTIDLTGDVAKFLPETAGPLPIDLFVLAGDPPAIMREYAALTGFPSMPPIWALGYQQSHRTLKDFDEVLWVAKTLRERKLPCDVLIYLGTGWCPSGWNTGHDSFTFNSKVFSDPEAQIGQLKELNYQVVLHSTYPPLRLYGSVLDHDASNDENEALRYWQRHQAVERTGISGWWPDAAEELSEASRLARIRMYWEGPQLDRPNLRPYALHRTGYAGMQRMGGWLWSGDVDATWETLRNHVPIAINTSLSGVPFWGTDIGGFYPTEEYSAELYVRWFEFMSFCPLFRSHGRTWYTHLPFGWNTGVLGPDEMEHTKAGHTPVSVAQLKNPTVEPICRKYLELRYRLMPYIYSMARDSHDTGMPLIRGLWLHYPDDSVAVARGDEYLWGRDFLVAPVVENGATVRSVYLPGGLWYDFWTNEKTPGGRTVNRTVDLETLPLYVRAGAVLPMGPVKQYTLERADAPLTLKVYGGASGDSQMYEDDGISFDYEKGAAARLRFQWDDVNRRLTISAGPGSKLPAAPHREIQAELLPDGTKHTVTFSGAPVSVQF